LHAGQVVLHAGQVVLHAGLVDILKPVVHYSCFYHTHDIKAGRGEILIISIP